MYRYSATQLNIVTNQSAGTIYIKIERQVSSSGATLVTKTITTNGTYDAEDDSADGFSSVTVSVPSANLTTKTIITNGIYDADDDNADGYSSVTVNVPSSANLTTKTITANGTYRASTDNVDGYSEITVNVSSGSGSGTPAHTIYFEYLDGTNTTISVDYSDSVVGTMITSYKPTIHNNKYVGLAQLDGVTWYSPANIPLNTELIDYSAVSNDTSLQEDGTTSPAQWYGVSDYTMIDPTMTFSYKGSYWGRICFYDETRTFISYFSIYNDGEQQQDNNNVSAGTLTPAKMPATARYVRISTLNDPDSSILSLIRTA